MNRQLLLICAVLLCASGALFAQPANDDCGGALMLELAADEASVIQVDGDTRGGTGDASVPNVCSATWFMDDIWYSVTMPSTLPADGIVISAFLGDLETDILEVGMGFYASCDSSASPIGISCFSNDPGRTTLEVSAGCLLPDETYYVRVWSAGHATDSSGTLRMGAYMSPSSSDIILWKETFGNGLEGWNTFGTCNSGEADTNATWKYLPDGLLDKGSYIFEGAGIASETLCDGAVGVDSDFDDTNGESMEGAGPCPAPGQYFLESPVLYSGGWTAAGLTITWTQAIRQFNSTYFVSYRTTTTGGDITTSDWTDFRINEEYPRNSDFFTNDIVRVFLTGATEGDSLQIRFLYNADLYMWGIDDVCLVETEANNMRTNANHFAIATAYNVPAGQESPFYGLNDIQNIGSKDQTNVNLNLNILAPDGSTSYNENISYGTIGPDSVGQDRYFTVAVDYSGNSSGTFQGAYTVTGDSTMIDTDFDWTDNQNTFSFMTNDEGWYQLEDGFTSGIWGGPGQYDDDAPYSLTWGNYMKFPKGSECTVEYIEWGISNPDAIPGATMNIVLYKWVDVDGDQVVQASERQLLGFGTVTINGDEGDNARFETELENFIGAPDDPIILEDGGEYLVMVEYNATDQRIVFFHSSDEFDYSHAAQASDQAGSPIYTTVWGLSQDGILGGLDYQVRQLNNGGVFFPPDIIAAIRMKVTKTTSIKDLLSDENLVELFPNPTNQKLTISMDFAEAYDEVQIQIMDVTGKLIESRRIAGVSSQNVELNVSQYANGAYILKVQTEDGSRTKRFVVQH